MKNSLEDKKFDFSKIDIDTIVAFCRDNTRYISAGVLALILVIVMSATSKYSKISNEKEPQQNVEEQGTELEQEVLELGAYAENEVPEINDLVSRYYAAYAAGNLEELVTLADPVSDMEKSYIQLMSQYVESYDNLNCYTKRGEEENTYLVSATFGMKFSGVEGTLPGLDFFYVRMNEAGALYIDNLYSSFNSEMKEQATSETVDALIDKFQQDTDVQKLKEDFQRKYTEVIENDVNLQNQVNTVTAAIQNWVGTYTQQMAAAQAAAEQAAAAQAAAEQAAAQAAAEQAAAEQAAQQQNGVNYVPEGTVITANDAYNLREGMSQDSERVGTVAPGDTVKIILSYAEGWTKVEWKDKVGYIRTDLLLNN